VQQTTQGRAALISLLSDLRRNIEKALQGKSQAIDLLLTALLAQGHVLLEDVPGVGKTTMARALARSIEGSFRRIQFTSDLLPADVTGTSVFQQDEGEFTFHKGPIFANVVLADEINRTTPKTQSSLLEAMNEGQVSVDGTTHDLPRPFVVAATQNPHEFCGTYPLPESQLDRFMVRIQLGYPDAGVERAIVSNNSNGPERIASLKPVIQGAQVLELQQAVKKVRVDDAILDYLMELVQATRNTSLLDLGLSPRGAMMLYRATQSLALVRGRDYCLPDDVKELFIPVAAHRVVPRGQRDSGLQDRAVNESALREILSDATVPV
jgi:MoxR-like ATPase